MNQKHTLAFGFAGWLFRLGLIGLAITAAAVITFGSPAATKTALSESGAYDQAASQLAKRASQEAVQAAGPSLEGATVESAAQASISPGLIQRDMERTVDSSYDWLRGDTQKLAISVDLTPYIDSFTNQLGDQAAQHVASLQPCTLAQLQQINPNNVNIFSLPCRPANLEINTIKNQAISQLTASNEFLSNPVIGTDSLPKDSQGQTALDRAAYVPQLFQLTLLLPWIFATVMGVGVLLLAWIGRSNLRNTIRYAGRGILASGITVLIAVGIAKLVFWFATRPDGTFSKLVAGSFSEVIINFTQSLEQAFSGTLLVFGIVYTILGIIGISLVRFFRSESQLTGPESPPVQPSNTPTTPPTEMKRP